MFIINCDRDQSYCKVDDDNVVFDEKNPPKEGDTIIFFYNNVEESGQVITKSDNIKKINQKFEELKKIARKRKHDTSLDEDDSSILSSKRSRKINAKYSSFFNENLDALKSTKQKENKKEDSEKNYKKIAENEIQLSIEENILDRSNTKISQKSSPSKDELKMMLEEAQKQIALSKNYNATAQVNAFQPTTSKTLHEQSNKKWAANDSYSTESELDDSNKENEDSNKQKKNRNKDRDDNKIEQDNNYVNDEKDKPEQLIVIMDNDHGEDLEDSDLYGKDWPNDKMVKLMDKVYCKESDLKLAISLSSQATHVARRLVTGVFKPSGYLNATFTGQAPRAHKHEGQLVPVKPLNEVARNEIVDYALHRASMKQWKSNKGIPQTREQVQRAMSQRIGELKRSYELTKNTKHS